MDGNRTSAANEPWNLNRFRNRRNGSIQCHFTISATISALVWLFMYLCEYTGCPSGSFNLPCYMLGRVLCIISFLPGLWKCMKEYWLQGKQEFCWLENKARMLNSAGEFYGTATEGLSVYFWSRWVLLGPGGLTHWSPTKGITELWTA